MFRITGWLNGAGGTLNATTGIEISRSPTPYFIAPSAAPTFCIDLIGVPIVLGAALSISNWLQFGLNIYNAAGTTLVSTLPLTGAGWTNATLQTTGATSGTVYATARICVTGSGLVAGTAYTARITARGSLGSSSVGNGSGILGTFSVYQLA